MTHRQPAIFAILLGCTLHAAAQTSAPPVKDDLFAGTEKFAQGASSVTQIDMDPQSLGKVEGKDGLKAHRTVLSVVHTYEYDKPGMYKIEDVESFRKKLDSGDWHCSVHMQQTKTGESTDICNKRRTDELVEKAIITVQPKALTFIHTIQHEGNWPGTGELAMPLQMHLFGPEMKAEMAIMQAEMQANMVGMPPQMQAFAIEMKDYKVPMIDLKDFKGPNPEEMKRLRESLKGLNDTQKEATPVPQP